MMDDGRRADEIARQRLKRRGLGVLICSLLIFVALTGATGYASGPGSPPVGCSSATAPAVGEAQEGATYGGYTGAVAADCSGQIYLPYTGTNDNNLGLARFSSSDGLVGSWDVAIPTPSGPATEVQPDWVYPES